MTYKRAKADTLAAAHDWNECFQMAWNAALEEAAKMVEDEDGESLMWTEDDWTTTVGHKIRQMKEEKP